uniref:Transposase n=1 Tax=Cyanothece sp. (strain PCC 7425 / ATCC 29141) TaxID=395961 RepID=B8HWN6_CYAP4
MTEEGISLHWKRNTEGIKLAAQRKREETFTRTDEAIKQLIRDRKPINFESVAEAANVTRAWIYKQPELRQRIETLRSQQASKKELPPQARASDASKTAMIATLREENKRLRAEIQRLKRDLESAYGQALGFEDLQSENSRLERQCQRLQQLLTEARAEIESHKRDLQ